MTSSAHLVLLLAAVASPLISAAEEGPVRDVIEIRLGETGHIQLDSAVVTGKPAKAVRVGSPNREYSVLTITYEAGGNGAKNRLKVRNGYDAVVMFKLNEGCTSDAGAASRTSDRKDHLMAGARPGSELSLDLPASARTVVLCDFTVSP